jgi:hypothetical protein
MDLIKGGDTGTQPSRAITMEGHRRATEQEAVG